MRSVDWLYLILACIAVARILDCKTHLKNIEKLLFDEQAKRNDRDLWKFERDPPI